jgi:hypothetical protein
MSLPSFLLAMTKTVYLPIGRAPFYACNLGNIPEHPSQLSG